MKTKTFEPGAICAAVALLFVFALPAYAKSGGSSAAHTRVGKTSTNATSVKSVTSSGKPQSKTLQKSGKEADAIRGKLGKVDNDYKETLKNIETVTQKQKSENDRVKGQQEKSGSVQKNLDAAADKRQETNKAINCLANC